MRLLLAFTLLVFCYSAYAQNVSFTSGPALPGARAWHEMQPLPDGKMMIMGGDSGDGTTYNYLKTTVVYNPVANAYEASASMNVARSNFMSVVLNDGNVMAIAGTNSVDNGIYSCEVYHQASDQWSYTDSLKFRYWGGKAVKLNDGRILVAGGFENTKCELYDPYTKTWSTGDEMKVLHGIGLSLTLLGDGRVVAVGGSQSPRALEVFSPVTNAWTVANNTMYNNHVNHGAVLMPNGNVLITGSSSFNSADQLSTESINGSTLGVTSRRNLLVPTAFNQLVTQNSNGNIITFSTGDIFSSGNTKIFQFYDSNTDVWSTDPTTAVGTLNYTMKQLPNGNIFICGGTFANTTASQISVIVKQNIYASCVPADLTIELSDQSAGSCYGKSATLRLSSTQSSTNYYFYSGSTVIGAVGGNGSGSMDFTLSADKFSPGDNLITVKVSKVNCPLMLLKDTVLLHFNRTNNNATSISLKTGNVLLCGSGSNATFQIDNPLPTGSYRWFNGLGGTTSTVQGSLFVNAFHIDASGCYGLPSPSIYVRTLVASDVSAGNAANFCESSPAIQLTALPAGGTWSGSGVSPTGLFTPSATNIGSRILTYSICGFNATKTVTVEASNTISYQAGDIPWPSIDTLCGGSYYTIDPINKKGTDQYRLYANGVNVGNTFTPERETVVTLVYMISRYAPSASCPKDTMKISRTYPIYPRPSNIAYLIQDTSCIDWKMTVKIIQPEKKVNYYCYFGGYVSKKFSTDQSIDTLIFQTSKLTNSRGGGNSSTYFQLFADPSKSCSTNNNQNAYPLKVVQLYDPYTRMSTQSVYLSGAPVAPDFSSNMQKFSWQMDGDMYTAKQPVTKIYTETGTHHYEVIATSRYGCADTLSSDFTVVSKAPLSSANLCLFDTIGSFNSTHDIFDIFKDKKGNAIYIGDQANFNYYDYSSGAAHSDNGYIRKYNSEGQLIWSLQHDPSTVLYDKFFSMYISSVTCDSENDLYIAGSYGTGILKFAGVTLDHSSESYYPYVHPFIAKISEEGQLLWFIGGYNSYSSPNQLNACTDIKYMNGKLYVAAHLSGIDSWKNQSGIIVPFLNQEMTSDYQILEVNINGSAIKPLASLSRSSYDHPLPGIELTHNNGYSTYLNQMVLTLPNLLLLPNNKLGVYSTQYEEMYFDSLAVNGGDYMGVIDLQTEKWDVLQSTSTPTSVVAYGIQSQNRYAVATISKDHRLGNYGFNEGDHTFSRSDANGNQIWSTSLAGNAVSKILITADENQVILIGTYKEGMTINDGGVIYGVPTTGSNKYNNIYAIGFNANNGKLLWMEYFGSDSLTDIIQFASLNACNELLIIANGFAEHPYYSNGYSTAILRESNVLNYGCCATSYRIKFSLDGLCDVSCPADTAHVIGNNNSVVTENRQAETTDLAIYPNPAYDKVFIKSIEGYNLDKVTLKDLQGKTLKVFELSLQKEISFDVSDLISGMYVLEIIMNKQLLVQKLSIVK